MSNENQNEELDFDNMSDEDFLKVSEADAMAAMETETSTSEEEPNVEETPEHQEDTEASGDSGEPNGSEDDLVSGNDEEPNVEEISENEIDTEDQSQTPEETDPMAGEGEISADQDKPKDGKEPKTLTEEDQKKAPVDEEVDDKAKKKPETSAVSEAEAFFKAVTTTFKADGKDFTVRTADEAIRLMQQGVNYSRRMHDLKPMKAMNRMLSDHGLADEAKLSFLIDVAKGDKTAIAKLLKDKGVDPMDLDTGSEAPAYEAKNYAGDPKENAFRDALDTTIASPDGKALVSDIHANWDQASKAKLRDDPSLLGNLLDLRQSGVYSKITDELDRQKALGYLTHVPFLQAFDQVGEAMKNVGLLDNPQPAQAANPMGQLQSNTQQQVQPVASGARKATASKKAQPNPHLSSTPPSAQTNTAKATGPDIDKLSDEDFLKLAPPS